MINDDLVGQYINLSFDNIYISMQNKKLKDLKLVIIYLDKYIINCVELKLL